MPRVSTKTAFFHAAQSSDRSPQRHPPPTRPEPAGRSELLWQTPVASEREELSTACYPVYRIIQTVSNQSPSLSSFSLPQQLRRKALIYATSQHSERGFICTS